MYTEDLMTKTLEEDNLKQAMSQVKKNKGAVGIDGMEVEGLNAHFAKNGNEIRRQIIKRKYKPQPVRQVEIPKADGSKRLLGIPTVTDRMIQQALSQILTPIFEGEFHENSYGFRPKRYAEMAIRQSLDFINEGYQWIVDVDLERFFDTVHHDLLMNLISRTVKDGDCISFVTQMTARRILRNITWFIEKKLG